VLGGLPVYLLGDQSSSGIRRVQKAELPEACSYKVWYHQHCMDIPIEVFDSSDVPEGVKSVTNDALHHPMIAHIP
jgi:hypothetical protein